MCICLRRICINSAEKSANVTIPDDECISLLWSSSWHKRFHFCCCRFFLVRLFVVCLTVCLCVYVQKLYNGMRFACACFVFIFCHHLSTFVCSTYLSRTTYTCTSTHTHTLMYFYVGNFHEQREEINQSARASQNQSVSNCKGFSSTLEVCVCVCTFFASVLAYVCLFMCMWVVYVGKDMSWVERGCKNGFKKSSHEIHHRKPVPMAAKGIHNLIGRYMEKKCIKAKCKTLPSERTNERTSKRVIERERKWNKIP